MKTIYALPIMFTVLAGCGYSGPAASVSPTALSGNVEAGLQPVSGAQIQLYAAGTSGNGSAAQPLLEGSVTTDSKGNFSIPATYGCPTPSSQVFLTAQGGSNSALTLMAMLSACSSLSSAGPISINEVTTVGSVWPLAQYMKAPASLGSAAGDSDFLAAVASVPEFINVQNGVSPGSPTAASSFSENAKLYSLANLLAACAGSTTGISACGTLFSVATPANGTAPTNTLAAAIEIAQNPANNVGTIFSAASNDNAFQPALTKAPTDWTLILNYVVATPAISVPSGTYTDTQQVTLTDTTPGATIYYTTDGSLPTTSSLVYQGAVTVSASSVIQATAFLKGSQSGIAQSTITLARPPHLLSFIQQPVNALAGAPLAPAVRVAVEDSTGSMVTTANTTVTLALTQGSGLTGTLSTTAQNGIATFNNVAVSAPGTYTLSAAAAGLTPATSTSFIISSISSTSGPVKLAFLQQPSNAVINSAISPAVTVAVEDATGNLVTNASNLVTVALGSGSGLAGTLTTASQNGVASFSNLTDSIAGTYTMSASSPGLTSALSASFTINPPVSSPPSVACSATPASVTLGGAVALTAVASSPQGRALTYSWSSSSGVIFGSGHQVQLNTSGVATGTITVTCSVTDTQGLTAAATASVTLVAPTSGSIEPAQCVPPAVTQPAAIQSVPLTIVPSNAINVLQNGAKGDGQTIDTPALEAILKKNPSGVIYFPIANYVLDNSTPNTFGLLFSGFHGTAFMANGAKFLCDTATTSAGQCIYVLNSSNATFDNFRVGYVDESQLPLDRNDSISNAILVENSSGVTFNNTTVEASTGSGIWNTNSTAVSYLNGTVVSNTTADGMHFENVGSAKVDGYTSKNTGDDALSATNIATSTPNCGLVATHLQITDSKATGIAVAGACGSDFSNFYIFNTALPGLGVTQNALIASRVPLDSSFEHGTVINAGKYPSTIAGIHDCIDIALSSNTSVSDVACVTPQNDGFFAFSQADQVTLSGVSVDGAPNVGFQTTNATNVQLTNTVNRNSTGAGYSFASTQGGSIVGATTCSAGNYGYYHNAVTNFTESSLISFDSSEGTSATHRAWWAEGNSGPMSLTGITVLDDQSHTAPVVLGGAGGAKGSLSISGVQQDLLGSTLQIELP